MKITIICDSFKETLTALEASHLIEKAFKEEIPEADYITLPFADGGEGTVNAIMSARPSSRLIKKDVTGPLNEKVKSFFGIIDDEKTAIIEVAAACGLPLIPENKRNPLLTTSYGVGELILAALDKGCRHFIIGLGGSATNDGGAGMLSALGIKFLDSKGEVLPPGGAALMNLDKIDASHLDPRIKESRFEIACDVDNPLTGEQGASTIFGPQKGASEKDIKILDSALKHYGKKLSQFCGTDYAQAPSSGAAGGLCCAFMAFTNHHVDLGIHIISKMMRLEKIFQHCDLVITGEGRLDGQSIHGKAPAGITSIAQAQNIPVIIIAGCFGADAQAMRQHGATAIFSSITKPCSVDQSLKDAKTNLFNLARNIASTILIGHKIK